MDKLQGQYLLMPDSFVEYRANSQEKLTDKALLLLYAFFYRAKYDREIIFTNNMVKNFLSDCANFTITRSLNLLKKFNYIDFSQKHRAVGNARKIVFTDKLLSFVKGGNFDINKSNATDLNNTDASVDNSINAHDVNVNDVNNDVDTDFNNDCAIDENHAILESGTSFECIEKLCNSYSKNIEITEEDANSFNDELINGFEQRCLISAFNSDITLQDENLRKEIKELKNFPKDGFVNEEDLLEDLIKVRLSDFSLDLWRFKFNDQKSKHDVFCKTLAQHFRSTFEENLLKQKKDKREKYYIIDHIREYTRNVLNKIKTSSKYSTFKHIVLDKYFHKVEVLADALYTRSNSINKNLIKSTLSHKDKVTAKHVKSSIFNLLFEHYTDAKFLFDAFNTQDFYKLGFSSVLLKLDTKNALQMFLLSNEKAPHGIKNLINEKIQDTDLYIDYLKARENQKPKGGEKFFINLAQSMIKPITTKDNQILNFI